MAETAGKMLGKQLQIQRIIERSLDNFRKVGRSNLTPAKIRSRVTSLQDYWIQYLNGHADLAKITSEAAQQTIAYFRENHFEATQEMYQEALDYMAECLEELEPPVSPNHSIGPTVALTNASNFSLAHLPPMNLPPFDGSHDNWEQFRDRFTALIIKNSEIRNFTRMHYLMSSLQGRALECIKELDVTAENFVAAWNALTSRYENKRRLLSVHLSALLNLPALAKESSNDLQSLVDKVNFTVASLRNLNRTSDELWQDLLVHMIAHKLDSATRKAWNLKICDLDGPPSFAELIKFVTARARALEEYGDYSPRQTLSRPSGISMVKRSNAASVCSSAVASVSQAATKPALACPLCNATHNLNSCPAFMRAAPTHRRELARRHKRCFNCLSARHSLRDCNSKFNCRVCHSRHHSLLHVNAGDESAVSEPASNELRVAQTSAHGPEVHSLLTAATNQCSLKNVLLATAWVTIRNQSGQSVNVRALLDQGSEMTFISENIVQLLRLKRVHMPVSVSAVGGVHAGTLQYASRVTIAPLNSMTPILSTVALIMRKLTSYAPKRCENLSSFGHLRGLPMADPNPTSSDPIDLIIGAELYNEILVEGLRNGRVGEPLAQNSIFGWFLSGPTCSSPPTLRQKNRRSPVQLASHHCLNDSSLNEDIMHIPYYIR